MFEITILSASFTKEEKTLSFPVLRKTQIKESGKHTVYFRVDGKNKSASLRNALHGKNVICCIELDVGPILKDDTTLQVKSITWIDTNGLKPIGDYFISNYLKQSYFKEIVYLTTEGNKTENE